MKILMRHISTVITVSILVIFGSSCKKGNNSVECFPGAPTVRQIVNKKAVIKVTATINPVWIIEQGSIDTKLIPCNCPMEFYQDGLEVMISGEVKSTPQVGAVPCCTENFVITKISKQ